MAIKIGIIGAGGIAKRLKERLEDGGYEVLYLLHRECRTLAQTFRSRRPIPQVMFVAISTRDKGESARDYIIDCVDAGASVVTCEKGSLAHHMKTLRPLLSSIKYTATVGGGTQMLKVLRDRHLNNRSAEVQAVLNGTCNFIFDEVARGGRTLGEACQEAIRLGYAEPGAKDPLSLINGELRDVVMKTCVLFNTTFAKKDFITPDTIGPFQLTAEQLNELSEKAMNHRLVVSFSNNPAVKCQSFFNGNFEIIVDGWHIQGGFRNIRDDTELLSWLPGGVGNAMHVIEGELGSGGKYTLTGPGAGCEATTTAMLNDLDDILNM